MCVVSLLPQAARRSDDPNTCDYDAGESDATPPVHPITGAFSDPHLTAEFGPKAFRRMFPLHVAGMGLMLCALVSVAVVERGYVAVLFGLIGVTAALGLWARVAVHKWEDTKKAQSFGALSWTIAVVVGMALGLFAMAGAPDAYCKTLDSPLVTSWWTLGYAFLALINSSHGLEFWHKSSLLGLVLLVLIAEAVVCHIKLATIMSIGTLVVMAATAHFAQLVARHNVMLHRYLQESWDRHGRLDVREQMARLRWLATRAHVLPT